MRAVEVKAWAAYFGVLLTAFVLGLAAVILLSCMSRGEAVNFPISWSEPACVEASASDSEGD